jgi:pimeloyl-ACP methyl ester carboxylesterase
MEDETGNTRSSTVPSAGSGHAFRPGYQAAGQGVPLVLVHGFPFDRRMWAAQLEGLAGIRRVIAPDLRGRGLSPQPAGDGWSLDDHADDVARLIEHLEAGPVDVGGLSMGGYVLFALMRRHPELVRSLILMSTRAAADMPEARKTREEQAALVRAEGTGALTEKLLPRVLSPEAGDDLTAQVRQMIEETPGETAAADLLAMRDRPDSTPMLGSITVPTFVLHGDDDPIVPVDEARDMASAMPNAHFSAIPKGRHLAPLEFASDANVDLQLLLGRLSSHVTGETVEG